MAFAGIISSKADNTITVADANWNPDEFADTHYVQITFGDNEGIMTTIISNTEDTLTTFDNLSDFIVGDETIAIRKYKTIGDVFGVNNSAGLIGAASSGDADRVLLPNAKAQSFDTYFYKTGGLGGIGWRSTNSSTEDASDTIILPGAGILVRRSQAIETAFGQWKAGERE